MALPMGQILLSITLILSILAIKIFKPPGMRRTSQEVAQVLLKYKWHFGLIFLVYVQKNFVDDLNNPIRGYTGWNFTPLIYSIEGDIVVHIQNFFLNHYLTLFFSGVYIVGYMFINYFTILFFIYMDDKELADKTALNYALVYLIATPFYLFFPVDVTSFYLSNVHSLLYDFSGGFHKFFVAVDPFDNCFPSLHIAIPVSIFILIYRSTRYRGTKDYDRYLYFLFIFTLLFIFAILYLGIHWVVDIFGGIFVALLAVYLVEKNSKDFWDWAYRLERRIRARLRSFFIRRFHGRKVDPEELMEW